MKTNWKSGGGLAAVLLACALMLGGCNNSCEKLADRICELKLGDATTCARARQLAEQAEERTIEQCEDVLRNL